MEIDRRAFIASLGGAAAVNLMDHEAKAEALEHYMEEKLDENNVQLEAERSPQDWPRLPRAGSAFPSPGWRLLVPRLFRDCAHSEGAICRPHPATTEFLD